jgi:phosphate transport system permease protein
MGIAGSVALGLIAIPVIVRTTEDMLRLVPQNLREAATAVGAPMNLVIRAVCWRAAKAGIVTGVLLSVARIFGETAPLLFTALNSQFWSFDLLGPMPNLPVTIYAMAVSPYERWRELGWAGAFLITALILVLSLVVRLSLRGASEKR